MEKPFSGSDAGSEQPVVPTRAKEHWVKPEIVSLNGKEAEGKSGFSSGREVTYVLHYGPS